MRGIPQEIIDRLLTVGGTSGHAEMSKGYDYDSRLHGDRYGTVQAGHLRDAGRGGRVRLRQHARCRRDRRWLAIRGVIVESRSGREAFYAKAFVDCTAYGDLAAYRGREFTEPNDYPVVNSIGVGNVSMEKLNAFLDRARRPDAACRRDSQRRGRIRSCACRADVAQLPE